MTHGRRKHEHAVRGKIRIDWVNGVIVGVLLIFAGCIVGAVFELPARQLWYSVLGTQPSSVEWSGQRVTTLDDQKRVMRSILVECAIDTVVLVDIDGDRKKELVLSASEGTAKPGSLIALTGSGRKLWECNTYDSAVMGSEGIGGHSDHFRTGAIAVAPGSAVALTTSP